MPGTVLSAPITDHNLAGARQACRPPLLAAVKALGALFLASVRHVDSSEQACRAPKHPPMGEIIAIGGREFVALRKRGFASTAQQPYHAVTPFARMALCKAEPGPSSGWAEPPAAAVTCPSCLQRLERMRDLGKLGHKATRARGYPAIKRPQV